MLLLLEHHIYRFDDSNFRMRFAINNDFVLQLFGPGNVEVVLLGKAIVPTAVPGCEPISIFLPGPRKCCASQRLHVYVSVGICVGREVRLRLNTRTCCGKYRYCNAITFNIASLLEGTWLHQGYERLAGQ